MRRQRFSHTYCIYDDGDRVEPDDVSYYDGATLQSTQDTSYLNLNYDWCSLLNMQAVFQPDPTTYLLNPYQYNLVWMSPIIEDMQTLGGGEGGSGVHYQNYVLPDLSYCQYFDPYSSATLYNDNIDYQQYQSYPEEQPFESEPYADNQPEDVASSFPVVTSYGTIAILLRHCVRVDLTADKAIYLSNFPARCIAAMNSIGDKTCVIHPNGKMFQDGITIHMESGNRVAKIARRGVTFTSLNHSLAYLVDASGTKSTAERFRSLNYDFPFGVFCKNSLFGQKGYEECLRSLAGASYRFYENGDEVWTIGGVRIKQNQWGEVRVSRNYGKRVIRTSPTVGTVSVTTPLIHTDMGCDPHRYFFVRKTDRQVSAHAGGFNVRNGSQKAGFDKNGKLVLR